jgi:hypothetical protein
LQNMEGKILHENINGTLFKPYKDNLSRRLLINLI